MQTERGIDRQNSQQITELEQFIVNIYARNHGTLDGWWSVYQTLSDAADCMHAVWRIADAAALSTAASIALAHTIGCVKDSPVELEAAA